jgi:hypothetical protein
MKNKTRNVTLIVSMLFFSILLNACSDDKSANGTETAYIQVLNQTATNDLSIIRTEAASTVFAQFTETALAAPTQTLTLTNTPSPTLTNTASPTKTVYYVWVVPTTFASSTPVSVTPGTPTVTSTKSAYSCSVSSQSISDGTDFTANQEFDASWTVKNTGTEAWNASEMDYRYISGTTTYKHNALYDMPASVAAGDSITITVDMIAPSSNASYETYWAVTHSSVTICSLPLRIDVVD